MSSIKSAIIIVSALCAGAASQLQGASSINLKKPALSSIPVVRPLAVGIACLGLGYGVYHYVLKPLRLLRTIGSLASLQSAAPNEIDRWLSQNPVSSDDALPGVRAGGPKGYILGGDRSGTKEFTSMLHGHKHVLWSPITDLEPQFIQELRARHSITQVTWGSGQDLSKTVLFTQQGKLSALLFIKLNNPVTGHGRLLINSPEARFMEYTQGFLLGYGKDNCAAFMKYGADIQRGIISEEELNALHEQVQKWIADNSPTIEQWVRDNTERLKITFS